jgi:hypothetical protein
MCSHLFVGREKEHSLLEGSQASPVRPSDTNRVKVKTLELLETVAWGKGRRILIFSINVELYNLKTIGGFDSNGV